MGIFVFALVVTGEKIPAALVFLEAERLQQEIARRIHIEALVIDINHLFIAHGTNDISQEAMAGRLALEDEAGTEACAFIDEAVEAKGLHHPFTDAAAAEFFFVLDVISIVSSGAFYLYAEDVSNGSYVIREGTVGELFFFIVDGAAHP